MRRSGLVVAVMLAGCGGGDGGTTGTNFSDPPPVAEIVATPTATPTPSPVATPAVTRSEDTMTMVDPANGTATDTPAED